MRGCGLIAAVAVSHVFLGAGHAGAQVEASELDSQPAATESTQLVTSTTEVRQAVIGLLVVALVSLILFALYWRLTGRAARERFEHQYGGRHFAAAAPRRRRRAAASAATATGTPRRAAPRQQPAPARAAAPRRARSAPGSEQPVVGPDQVHPGWVDPSGRRRQPATVHPAWVEQGVAGARAAAMVGQQPVTVPETRLEWDGAAATDSNWPRPFENR